MIHKKKTQRKSAALSLSLLLMNHGYDLLMNT